MEFESGSEGLQRTETLAHALFGTLCPSKAEHKQYPDHHPFLWSQSPTIPTIRRLYDPIRLPRSSVESYPTPTNVPQLPTPPSPHSNVPSPANSMSPATPPNYKGDSHKDSFIRHVKYNANIGRQHIPTIPPHPHVQALFPNTGAPEDADLNRYKAPVTEEHFECPSALGSHQVQHRLRIVQFVSLARGSA